MEIQLKSTTKMVELDVGGVTVPARIWEGNTENGTPCHAYITRIACSLDEDQSEFERDLQEHDAPSAVIEAIPMRLIL